MSRTRLGRQPDLFAPQPDLFDAAPAALLQEPPPADFIQRIRDELTATVAKVTQAATLPWSDRTKAYLAELRFRSICTWLPDDEATALKADFHRELDRLYDIWADERGFPRTEADPP